MKTESFVWKPARGDFNNLAKFIGVQFNDSNERMLVAGNVEFHSQLSEGVKIRKSGPVTLFAAGSFQRDGAIKSWHSLGYSFQTPYEEEGQIASILANHLQQIQELWGKVEQRNFRL